MPPPGFICPITQGIMMDPVCDRDGNSFERDAIEAWIEVRGTSPITRSPLAVSDLVPNRSLKTSIEEYLDSLSPEAYAQARPGRTRPTTRAAPPPATAAAPAAAPVVPPPPSLPALTLSMLGSPSLASGAEGTTLVLTTISSPEEVERIPSDIVCVIDVSGSMGSEASVGGLETTLLSLLDITKHAVKTIINTLEDQDRLALISFSDNAQVVCGLTVMNAAGRARATDLVNTLHDGGSTNLWDGLVKGLDVLKGRTVDAVAGVPGKLRNGAIMLLTDGQPSIEPPRGHLPMLRRWRDQNEGKFPGLISTFGFGYNLDSRLLTELAVEGGGSYSFIPDAGFVGTAFVHALANTLTTVAKDAVLKLEPEDNEATRSLAGYAPQSGAFAASWGYEQTVGALRAGQPFDSVVRLGRSVHAQPASLMQATLAYQPSNTARVVSLTNVGPAGGTQTSAEVAAHSFRLDFVEIVSAAHTTASDVVRSGHGSIETDQRVRDCLARVERLTADMRAWIDAQPGPLPSTLGSGPGADAGPGASAKERVAALLADLDGQVREALSKHEYFQRWGRHYIPSLVRAHQLQACNNFKDPGLQYYGGRLFRAIRDRADDIFSDMPAPTPSLRPRVSRSYGYSSGGPSAVAQMNAADASAPVSMRSYNSRATPCVHGLCPVLLAPASAAASAAAAAVAATTGVAVTKPAWQVRAGDVIATGSGSGRGRVVCVLKTLCPSGHADLVTLPGGLQITAWHPVSRAGLSMLPARDGDCQGEGAWEFPCQVAGARLERVPCDAVYSFLVAPMPPLPLSPPAAQALGHVSADSADSEGDERFASSLFVGGWAVCALAHGIRRDAVASHAFFGTSRVAAALRQCRGWAQGLVTFLPNCVVKSSETGLAVGLDLGLEVEAEAEAVVKEAWRGGVLAPTLALVAPAH